MDEYEYIPGWKDGDEINYKGKRHRVSKVHHSRRGGEFSVRYSVRTLTPMEDNDEDRSNIRDGEHPDRDNAPGSVGADDARGGSSGVREGGEQE